MDERLRALERRGELGEEQLQAQLRAGRVTRDQVELAALLGHGPARTLLGDAAPVGWSYRRTDDLLVSPPLVAWVKALEARHREAPGRAALAAARLAVSLWSGPTCEDPQLRGLERESSPVVRGFLDERQAWARRFGALLDAAEAWLEAPGKPRVAALRAAFPFPPPGEADDLGWSLFVPVAVRSASEWTLRPSPWKAATGAASWGITHAAGALVARHARDVPREAWERVLGHIRDAVVPWALRPASAAARPAKAAPRVGPARGRFVLELPDGRLDERADWTPLPAAAPPRHDGRWWLRPETLEHLRQEGTLAGAAGLRLTGLQAGDADLERVAALPELRWLSLRDLRRVSDVGLGALRALPRLEALDLWGCAGITGRGLGDGFAALRELVLARTSPSKEGLAAVGALAGLERLDLSGCEGLSDPGPLRGLVGLRELDLSETPGLGDLAALAGLARLETLDLSKTTVTDAGLAHLAGLTSLRELRLRGCAVRGRGLSHLPTGVRALVLAGCPLRPKETVEALERLPGLELLDLRGASPGLVKLARARLERPGRTLRLEALA